MADGSTLSRFPFACTRLGASSPTQQRPVLLEQQDARTGRVRQINDYRPELFRRTRCAPRLYIIIDLDPTDDPAHRQQVLSFHYGHYQQHQYLPLLLQFDDAAGLPLGAWLRPGKVYTSCGTVEALEEIVQQLRRAWL